MDGNMRKLIVLSVQISMIVAPIAAGNVPVRAQSSATLNLSACQFSVGLGDQQHGVDAQCGTLAVPEDPSKPDGKKIDLHVTVLAATGPNKKPEPIFHFEGGPGGSAIRNFGETFYSAYRLLRQDHDIVLLDQRGTGLSSSLQCTEITDAALDDLAQPETKEDSKIFTDRLSACLKRLSATTDPAHYTSTILADDTDAVRAALGYDQIDVYGASYGTWLGQIYLGRHGDHVHAMVLDSVGGPWDYYLLDAANNAQASLDKIFALCKADAACDKAYPDLTGTLNKLLESLDKKPADTSGLGTLTGQLYTVLMTKGRFLEALRSMMYQSANISVIPKMISDAAAGDFTLASAQAALEGETAPEISLGLYYSVHCSESLPFYTPALIKQYQHGNFFGADDKSADELAAACKSWRSAEVSAADVAPVKSDQPVLIFAGMFDPITSVGFAQSAHERLSHSTLAVFPYQAHGPLVGSKCAQKLATAFFDAPDQAVDSSCTAQDVKPLFAGAVETQFASYADPRGAFSVNIPKGWAVQPEKSKTGMTFFENPNGLELLGMGVYMNTNSATAQQSALKSIADAYGPVDVEFSLSLAGVTQLPPSMDRPGQVCTGVLLIRPSGANVQIIWLAAPGNVLQTRVQDIILAGFMSFAGH